MVYFPIFKGFLPLKGHLEFSGTFFLAEIFEKVSFDPYSFRITRLSARKSENTFNNATFKWFETIFSLGAPEVYSANFKRWEL